MWQRLAALGRRGWVGYAAALAAVALVSVVIGLLLARVAIANISMLYLIAVLATAVVFGSGPAILASLAAFLTFDFFFVQPIHTFTVADPEEWVSLLLFLITATITGQLAAAQRRRAQEAVQREREAVFLYDLVRLLAEPDFDQALAKVAERIRREFQLGAVALEIQGPSGVAARAVVGTGEARERVQSAVRTATHIFSERRGPADRASRAPGRWVRVVPPQLRGLARPKRQEGLRAIPIRVGERRIGTILLAQAGGAPPFGDHAARLLAAAAAQLGLAAERVQLRSEATEAEILRRTDELKTALLNAVSHDLRTPLASIIASAGSLRQEDVPWTDQERREFAEAIEEEAQRLNRIVGNLLDLSRIEGGNLRPEKGWYDLGALIDDVLGRLRPLTAHHQVSVSVPDDLPPVSLDYVEIDQVLSNLIENAAKYAPPGTAIEIAVRCTADAVRVEVADRGPGVPESARAHLFEPFYRLRGERPQPRGVGLGLAVARGLVEAHGGRIWVENRVGGGARFVFTLPLATPVSAGGVPRSPEG